MAVSCCGLCHRHVYSIQCMNFSRLKTLLGPPLSPRRGHLRATTHAWTSLVSHGCRHYHNLTTCWRHRTLLRPMRARWRGGRRGGRWSVTGGCDHMDGVSRLEDRRQATSGSEFMGGVTSRGVADTASTNSLLLRITEFDSSGNHVTRVIRKSELLAQYDIQARDIRFSASSSLFVRSSSIIIRLQHIKAIVSCDSLVLLDSDHPAMQMFIPELKDRLRSAAHDSTIPFEFHAVEAMLMKMFTVLDDRLQELMPALTEVLNSLLDPRLFSVDRGQLHILLHHSRSLSEFFSLVKDIEATLSEVLDQEEDMADMYLTHWNTAGEDRETDDIEEINNILEAYLMQAENILSEIQKLREMIDQSESIILINLDSQRNVMLRLGLQLEMGMFSATVCGLLGMAFGMNLNSSLEEDPYVFWVVTGLMFTGCGLLWRRLLTFLGKNLDRPPIKRLGPKPPTKST